MPSASPSCTSKPSMMFARWQRTGLVPPQQPPLMMKAKGSPPSAAAARTRASSRRARGVIPSQPGTSGEEVHREVVQVDPHLLELRQVLDHRDPVLAPVAGELVAPERRVGLDHVPGVDPYRAGLQPLGETVRPFQVLRLHARGEAVDHVVADADGVVLIVEAEHARHRTEDLLLRDLHLVVDLGEDRGLVVEPSGERGILRLPAAAAESRALFLADLDVALDLAQLLLRDERTHAGREIHRIAHLHLLRALYEALDEPVVEALLDEDAGAGGADLAAVHVQAEQC